MSDRKRPKPRPMTRARQITEAYEAPSNPSLVVVQSEEDQAKEAERKRQQEVAVLLALARKQFETVSNFENELRNEMSDDMRFVASQQWSPEALAEREDDDRPAMTINRLGQFIRQVVNQVRVAHQGIQVRGVDSGADPKTAEVYQGIIRHIEQESDAQRAYVTAAEAQARMGRGFIRVVREWNQDGGFRQNVVIRRVRNPLLIYMDPASQEVDGSDARYCFVVQDMPLDVYRDRFGDASVAGLEAFRTSDAQAAIDWMPTGCVRIAEWWRVVSEWDEELLIKFSDGKTQIVHKSIYETWPEKTEDGTVLDRGAIIKRRPLERRKVKCALINAVEILEGNDDKTDGSDEPGSRIPIFPVIGEELDLNGRVDYRGMVRDAKDAQRMYNYQNSALAEALALAPKAPYIGYAGQFENHENKWNLANRRNFSYLEINPKSLDGNLLPMPQRTTVDPGVGAIVAAIAQADNDLKATMGLFEPSMGERHGDQSGKAITALQRQGELANSNFQDNLMATIRAIGRHLIEVIPKIYDVPTVLRILGTDERPKTVMVHAGNPPEEGLDQLAAQGVLEIYDLSVGKFDVIVTAGPTDATRRQEALTGLLSILQANPQAFAVLGDLVVENMDWAGAQVAAKRLKSMLPPEMQDEQKDMPPQAIAMIQQATQQVQQLQQQLQQATMELQEAKGTLTTKQIEKQMLEFEWAARERLERLRLDITQAQAAAKMHTDAQAAQTELAVDRAERQADRQHESALEAQKHRQDLEHAVVSAGVKGNGNGSGVAP